MSVQRINRKNGTRYVLRYIDRDGVQRQESFSRKGDAESRELDVKRQKEMGLNPSADSKKLTLNEYVTTRWVPEHVSTLSKSTRDHYRSSWKSRIKPHLGSLPLAHIDPATIKQWQAAQLEQAKRESREAGADRLVGQVAIERALTTVLSGILRSAVEDGLIPTNPVSNVRKKKVKLDANGERRAPDELVILDPLGVECLRQVMDEHDATYVAVLAYAGLRPGEAWRLKWSDIGTDGTVRVWASKTARVRYVPLRAPLMAYLNAWREVAPDPVYVFGERDHRAWVRRHFRPAVTLAGLPERLRPYDLRHTCASLLNAEHRPTVEAAGWMGHSHTLYLDTYTHIIDSLRSQGRVDVDEVIRQARAQALSGGIETCAFLARFEDSRVSPEVAETPVSPVVIGDW